MGGTRWSKTYKQLSFGATVALTAVKLQMFGGKTPHVWHPIRTCFFVSCPRLDATDGSTSFIVAQEQHFSYISYILSI